MALSGLSRVADGVRRAGWKVLFGDELDRARFAHWTAQWYPPGTVEQAQWSAVVELVAHARGASPFYRRRVPPSAGPRLTRDEFRRIPPLTRADLSASAEAIRVPGAGGGRVRRRSGGSSGTSIGVPVDRATYCWYIAGTWRGLRWWGTDLTERGAVLLGPGSTGLLRLAVAAKDWVMNWLREPVTERFDAQASRILSRLARFEPAFLYGYPSALHRLAREAQATRWTPRRPPKVAVLTGEPVYGFQRRAIQEIFQCPIAEEYGNGELGSMAFRCPEGSLHVAAESVYLETVPLEFPAPEGAGLILATQLRNRLFPLIRYETGDVGILGPATCRCGRGLPTVRILARARERLTGREGDGLAAPRIEALLDALPEPLQDRVRVVHSRPGAVVLEVERNHRGADGTDAAAAVGAEVLGPGWHVAAVEVERLARLPSGKRPQFVRSEADA